jgi:hypothetical protein
MPDTPHAVPWWLWPNVLSLDAPAVAVVWQRFLGSSFGVMVPVLASVVLALVVWGIYLTDHYFDACAGMDGQTRHQLAAAFRGRIAGLAIGSLFAAATLSMALPASYLIAGGILASLVCAYFALVHISVLKRATAHGEKELLVGLLFATGVAVPLLAEHPEPSSWFASVVGFGLVCWLNCRLIDRWEEGMAGGDIQSLVIALAAALCAEAAPLVVGSAIAACTGLLILLHLVHQRIGPRPARVLADVAMFTPVAAWCFS